MRSDLLTRRNLDFLLKDDMLHVGGPLLTVVAVLYSFGCCTPGPLPTAIVTNATNVDVPEGGTASFQVKLNEAPCANVQVSVAWVVGDTDITVSSGASLMFTPQNWDTYQTVTLVAARDADANNGVATIRCSADGWTGMDVRATEVEVPAGAIVTDVNDVNVPEGGIASFQVKLSGPPQGDVKVSVVRIDGGDTDITVSSGASLTFAMQNWDTYQTVTLKAALDADSSDGVATIRCSADGWTSRDVTARERDTSGMAITTDVNEVNVPEGGTASFRVKLDGAPTADVKVSVAWREGDTDITVSTAPPLMFTSQNWSEYQTVTLRAAPDADTSNGEARIRCSADGWTSTDVKAKEVEAPMGAIVTDVDEVNVPEDGNATFRVKLGSRPSNDVTISVERLHGDGDLTVLSGSSLTFTPENWDTYQTVKLAAAKDGDRTNDEATICCSAAGWTGKDVIAHERDRTNIDGPAFSEIGVVCTKEASNANCGIRLVHRWAKRDLTYSFHGFPETVKAKFVSVYEKACEKWHNVAPLQFHRVESPGDIQIWWIDPGHPDYGTLGLGLFEALANFPQGDQPVMQRINGAVGSDWSFNFALRVAAHELGHNLGLLHAQDENALMSGLVFSDLMDLPVELGQADVDAIQEVYGAPGDATAPQPVFPPIDPNVPLPLDPNDDPDGDGLDTRTELLLTWPNGKKCDPYKWDTDGDGLSDGYEVRNLLNPTERDSDGDGIDDNVAPDVRGYVVVVNPRNVVIRKGAPLCGLPAWEPNETGGLSVGLKAQDFLRAGFLVGDTVTATVPDTGKSVAKVQVVRWAEAGCAAWISEGLRSALGISQGASSNPEFVLHGSEPNVNSTKLTILYPSDGAFVKGDTDLIAKITGGQGQVKEIQFFVFAPDPWRYYAQPSQRVTLTGTTFVRATTRLGSGAQHDGLKYHIWADMRDIPEPADSNGVLGPPQVSVQADRITLIRGNLDSDDDCIPDANEINAGSNPRDANDPFPTPPPQPIECCDEDSIPVDWHIDTQLIALHRLIRGDGLAWLQVDWGLAPLDANYACVSRKFSPPIRMELCQKIKADIQSLGEQRIKVELKTTKAHDDPNWVWVRTETFVFQAGEFQTVVVDAPKLWGDPLAERGAFDLHELTFTIDRRHENALSGTYWLRNIRLVGRSCDSCSN